MKHWIFAALIGLSINLFAQTEDLDANQKGFTNTTQAGKLFQLKVHPTDKHLHLFVTGVTAGELKLDDATIEASIGTGNAKKTFFAEKTQDPKTGKFFYKLKKQGTEPLNLKIQSEGKSENFTFPPPN